MGKETAHVPYTPDALFMQKFILDLTSSVVATKMQLYGALHDKRPGSSSYVRSMGSSIFSLIRYSYWIDSNFFQILFSNYLADKNF